MMCCIGRDSLILKESDAEAWPSAVLLWMRAVNAIHPIDFTYHVTDPEKSERRSSKSSPLSNK